MLLFVTFVTFFVTRRDPLLWTLSPLNLGAALLCKLCMFWLSAEGRRLICTVHRRLCAWANSRNPLPDAATGCVSLYGLSLGVPKRHKVMDAAEDAFICYPFNHDEDSCLIVDGFFRHASVSSCVLPNVVGAQLNHINPV